MNVDGVITALVIQSVVLGIVAVVLAVANSVQADRGGHYAERARPVRIMGWVAFILAMLSLLVAAWIGAFS